MCGPIPSFQAYGRDREVRIPVSRVHQDDPGHIAANELAAAADDQQVRHQVRMQRRRVAGADDRLDDADALVLEDHPVVIGGGDGAVELGGWLARSSVIA